MLVFEKFTQIRDMKVLQERPEMANRAQTRTFVFGLGHPNKLFRFPSPCLLKLWVGWSRKRRKSMCLQFTFAYKTLRLICKIYNQMVKDVQSNPDNSNLQGKQKKVRVIGSSSYRELRTNDLKEGKTMMLCTSIHTMYISIAI